MGYFTFSYDLKDSTKSSEDIIRRKLINLIHPYSKNILERGVATTFVFDSIKSIGQLHAKISDELGNEIYFYLSEIKTTNELFLKKQINDFHLTLLPQIEKELDAYKQVRMQEIDKVTIEIVQKASQDIFNKTISLTEHQNVITQSLDKAKKEGVFD